MAVFLDGRFIGSDTDLFKMTCHSDIFVVSIPMKSSSLMKQKFTSDYLSYLKNTKVSSFLSDTKNVQNVHVWECDNCSNFVMIRLCNISL